MPADAENKPKGSPFSQELPDAWEHKSTRSASLLESFFHAFHGFKVALSERNLRIHFCLAPLVIGLAFYLKVEPSGIAALIFAIGLVIAIELMNTAIEHMVNIQANFQYSLSARYAKDTAAAAVLFAAMTAVAIGLVVLGPKLLALVGW